MATRFRLNFEQIFGTSAQVLAGGTLTFCISGGAPDQLQAIYSDDALTVTKLNPVTLDSAGKHGDIFLQAKDYRVIVKDAAGIVLPGGDVDPVHGGIGDSGVIATGGNTVRSIADHFGDVVNVKDYGAIGDGVANDTAAIIAALATGRSVYVPYGTYQVTTDGLILGNAQTLYGDGKGASVIKSFSTTGSIVTIGGTGTLTVRSRIHDISIWYDNSVARQPGQRCVRISNAATFNLDRVDMLNGLICLSAEDCLIYTVSECEMRNGEVGIDLVPGVFYPQHNLVTYVRNKITGNTNYAIRGLASGNNTFHQLVIENNQIEANGTDGSGDNVVDIRNIAKTGVGAGVSVLRNWFERSRGLRDLYLQGQNLFTTFEVTGNNFFSSLVTTDNMAVATGSISGDGNGLIVGTGPGPANNVTFAADVGGVFLRNTNRTARLNNLGTVITDIVQATGRTAFALAPAGSTGAGAPVHTTKARYSKLGPRVTVVFETSITNLGGMTGDLIFPGLPFASVDDGGPIGVGIVSQFDGLNLAAGGTNVAVLVRNGVAVANLLYSIDAGASKFLPIAELTAPVYITCSFSYDAVS